MKKNLFYVMSLAGLFALSGCSQEELADVQNEDAVKLGIASASIGQSSRAVVETSYLPDGAQMGVFLRESGKDTYDGVEYSNILYTATGTTNQTWGATNAPEMSNTTGQVYAYYPYDDTEDIDITAIPVDLSTGDVDFMYSTTPASVNYSNPEASLTMRHLCALIRITFRKGTYEGNCNLHSIRVESSVSTSGTFNLLTNEYTPKKDEDGNIEFNNIDRIMDLYFDNPEGATVDLLLYPHTTGPFAPSIYFGVDQSSFYNYGSIFYMPDNVITDFQAGKIYKVLVTINRESIETRMTSVTSEPWSEHESTFEYTETI